MNKIRAILVAASLIAPQISSAVIDQNPANAQSVGTVHLRTDCTDYLNCVTDTTQLIDWVLTVRTPSTSNPLLVDIGPGTFTISEELWLCLNSGNTTYRGSGIENTLINSTVYIENCSDLTFSDLTIRDDSAAVDWSGGGKAVWTNVSLEAETNATKGNGGNQITWWDHGCSTGERSVHYWFGSKLKSAGRSYNYSLHSECGEHWFYGGEILTIGKALNGTGFAVALGGARLEGNSMLQAFGSSIRALSGDVPSVNPVSPGNALGIYSVFTSGTASFHMHGGILTAKSTSSEAVDVAAIISTNNSSIHVLDTAFTVEPSNGGNGYRILNNSATTHIGTAYQWPASDEPPAIVSEHGMDSFVETDCAAGGCENTGNETHLMIYNTHCAASGPTADPWFDVVTGACRGGGTP